MQMVKKIFILLAVLWFALLWLMPKQEMYYKLEKVLAEDGIKINEKSIEEGWFSLTLHESDIYAKGIKLATAQKVSICTLLFYSSVEVENLVLDDSLKAMAPTHTDKATLTHAIWNPLHVSVEGQGSFGGLDGDVALADKTVRLDFNETKGVQMFKPKLKQDEKGWYYETSF